MRLTKELIVVASLHMIALDVWTNNPTVVPRSELGNKPKTLIVSLVKTVPVPGVVRGFSGSPGEQSDTFLPDDTCAWSKPDNDTNSLQ